MKGRLLVFCSMAVLLMLAMCTKDSNDPPETKTITFVNTNPGGCNGVGFGQMKSMLEEKDTIYFKLSNDSLDGFVGINYICCAPFESETQISGDSIFMTVRDTCPAPYFACYCKCMCYYTWDFLFTDVEDKDYYYRLTLDSPLEEGPRVLWEGKFGK